MNTIVIGLGNPILTDDGVGVKVARRVEQALSEKQRQKISVAEASVGGLRLMEMMINYDRVILIDAYMQHRSEKPGTIHRMSLDDLCEVSPIQHSGSTHDTTLVKALEAGERMGAKLPKEFIIFAVEVEKILDFGEEPTPAVAAAIPKVTEMVLDEIKSFES